MHRCWPSSHEADGIKSTWQSVCPHVQVSTPRIDMCHELSRKEVSAARGEEETVVATEPLGLHVRWASKGWEHYSKSIQETQQEVELTMDSWIHAVLSPESSWEQAADYMQITVQVTDTSNVQPGFHLVMNKRYTLRSVDLLCIMSCHVHVCVLCRSEQELGCACVPRPTYCLATSHRTRVLWGGKRPHQVSGGWRVW